jgi:opacity protein-like surface antigen
MAPAAPPPARSAGLGHRWRIGLAALLAAAVTLGSAGAAQAWVRREGRWWTYYLPTSHWVAAESASGLDISSPTGVLYAGYGFSSSPFPLTHQQVVDYTVRSGGLDVHPVRSVRFTSRSGYTRAGPALRRIYQWQGVRTDRRERVRGVFTVDVFRDDATTTYGFAASTRVTPTAQFSQQPLLRTVVQRMFFHPRD